MNDVAAGAVLDILAPKPAPIECVPAIMDLDVLPDMGRMTGRLPQKLSLRRLRCRGSRAAAIYSLIESVELNGLNPQHYLADLLARIADHPARCIAELPPWNWQPLATAAAAA
jgi:IS66 C-terminal element